jgi:hypothetical protein
MGHKAKNGKKLLPQGSKKNLWEQLFLRKSDEFFLLKTPDMRNT